MLISDLTIPLYEARTAPLYHLMTAKKTVAVFEADEIVPQWEHDIPGIGQEKGTRMSRNQYFRFGYGSVVRLTFDQNRLAQTNKIIPLDAERIHYYTSFGKTHDNIRDRKMHRLAPDHAFAEEYVLGPIKPLHRYLTGISILGFRVGSDVFRADKPSQQRFIGFVKEYAKRYSIPFKFYKNDPSVIYTGDGKKIARLDN